MRDLDARLKDITAVFDPSKEGERAQMLINLSNKTDSNETKIASLISKVNDF